MVYTWLAPLWATAEKVLSSPTVILLTVTGISSASLRVQDNRVHDHVSSLLTK